jgi:isocitrate lyase
MPAPDRTQEIAELERRWAEESRWAGIERVYSAEEVVSLRGSMRIRHTIAEETSRKLWDRLNSVHHINALGALSGGQAVQMVKGGLQAIYLSGWQVAADGNLAGSVYPDQSLYPANSVPAMVRRLNNALQRADQITWAEGDDSIDWFQPIVADAEAGFGGPLNAYELMRGMIEAGAAGVHYEDQLASEKKCGPLGAPTPSPPR